AIPRGGLASGALSNPVEIVFTNPSQSRFSLVPQILTDGPDAIPTFTPVGPLTVTPGGPLAVSLQAADPDSERITFSLQSSAALPTGSLQGDGTLIFTPSPAEVGTYSFTLIASDGSREATQNVTLTVAADPVTTTRISGVVENTSGQPLANVPVDVTGVSTTTGSDGSFLLDLGSGGFVPTILNVHGDQRGGTLTYPFVDADLVTLLGHAVFPGANNVVPQPIFLTAVDTSDQITIDPAANTTVTTPALPGAALTIAAGTLTDSSGNPYTGPLGITQVPTDETPLPLGLLHPDLIVMIQPGGVLFSSPATLAMPNPSGWPAGAQLGLWSLDPASGQFKMAGTGQVSSDGSVHETTSGGVSNSTLYFFLPHGSSPVVPAVDPLAPLYGQPAQ